MRSPLTRLAAACALLALLTPAPTRAELVLSAVNQKLTATPDGPNQVFALDIDRNGVVDFRFTTIIADPADPTLASFTVVDFPFGTRNAAVIDAVTGDGFPSVSLLREGDVVSAGTLFSGPNDQGNLFFVTFLDPPSGNFLGQSGFLGVRFERDGQLHNGFVQVTLNDLFAPTDPLALTIGVVGYESVAGAPVTLRSTPVPEPASVAVLGLGLAAVAWGRRRRQRPAPAIR